MRNLSAIRSQYLSIVVAFAVILTACSGGQQPSGGNAAADTPLRIATYGGITSNLDPFEASGRNRANHENIYEPLVYPYRDTMEIKGVLAESWTISSDGNTYRFNLRKNVTFHDGTTFDAQSVKDTYELYMKIGKGDFVPYLKDVKEIRVVDPNTVEFVIGPPLSGAPFLARLAGLLITSSKQIKAHGEDLAWWATNSDGGSGPFNIEQVTPKDRVVLARYDKWWGQKPFFSKVVFLEVPEASAQALMIEKGEIDIALLVPPTSLDQFQTNPNLRVLSVKGDRVLNFRMNIQRPPLNNKLLRQALAYAFDYQAVQTAKSRTLAPPDGPVPSQYLSGWTSPNVIKAQNLDKAKALLAQAGYKPGDLTISVTTATTTAGGDTTQKDVAQILQQAFAKIGVNVTLKEADFTTTFQKLQRYKSDPKANAADADGLDIFTLVRGPYIPHPVSYFSSYNPGITWNYYDYRNPEADKLFEQGYRATSNEAALNSYKQALELIIADQPDIWAYIEKRTVVMRSDIEGYYMHPTLFPEMHVETISRKTK
jgi:peptide/nickel transport system substrate-binding protein